MFRIFSLDSPFSESKKKREIKMDKDIYLLLLYQTFIKKLKQTDTICQLFNSF